MTTTNTDHAARAAALIASGKTLVRVADIDNDSWCNGWVYHIMDNYHWVNTIYGIRADLTKPKPPGTAQH